MCIRDSIKFIGLLGAPEGIKALHEAHPDVDIYLGAQDDRLNENGYIVPGLGCRLPSLSMFTLKSSLVIPGAATSTV